MADEITAAGKYLLISVPDFAKDPVGREKDLPIPNELEPTPPADPDEQEAAENLAAADRRNQPMTSFLRMGAFHENAKNAGGAVQRSFELAELAKVVSTSQGGPATLPFGSEVDNYTDVGIKGVDGDKERGVFLGDQRTKLPKDGTKHSVNERLEQSAALLSRGGWWDHSDGNRVSTTYGDKVEVIRGNYKMVVMHRQDDPAGGGGWDVSGGHIQDLGPASMPGASVRLEFRPGTFNQGGGLGTWHLENTTNNFNQTSDFAGDFYEHWYGDHKESTIGSESPKDWDDTKGKPLGNPAIIEKTWASKIESYTGSRAWRIPTIKEETYADAITSVTDVSGILHDSTTAGVINETTTAGVVASTTTAGNITETTTAAAIMSTTLAPVNIETNIIGAALEVSIGHSKATLDLYKQIAELALTVQKLSIEIGTIMEIFVGVKRSLVIGDTDEICIPEKKEVTPEVTHIHINQTNVTMNYRITAIQQNLTAVQVNIGV